MKTDFIDELFKFLKMEELVFIVFKDEEVGYSAFESKHALIVIAKDRFQLIHDIKKQITDYFKGKFRGKIIREVVDEEIKVE